MRRTSSSLLPAWRRASSAKLARSRSVGAVAMVGPSGERVNDSGLISFYQCLTLGLGRSPMQITVRGSLQVAIRVENLGDVLNVMRGFFKSEFVRAIDVPDALVAPATSCFAMPARLINQLKLKRLGTRKA